MQILTRNTTFNKYEGMFSRDALYFAFVANVLPSVPYFVLAFFVCPQRFQPIVLYLVLAVIGLQLNVIFLAVLAALIVVFDVVVVTSGIFNFSPELILDSVKYSASLDLFSFAGYTLFACAIAFFVGLYVYLIVRNRQKFKQISLVPAILMCCVMLALDFYFNMSPQTKLARAFQDKVEFTSAMSQTGLDQPVPAAKKQNVLVVMVESMGAYADPAHQRILWEILQVPEIEAAFEITTGQGPYDGSTTAAESRELCGRWGDYPDYLEKLRYDCLPAAYADAGYETAAFDAFYGALFDRTEWFPRIGFQSLFFREQLEGNEHIPAGKTCGLTFKGLCDLDLADAVEAYLDSPGDKPKFAYWLTLHTHLPLEPNATTPRLDCDSGGPFDDWTICTMTEMWMDLFYRVKEIALNPDLQNTQILLVGDHHPPVWTRQGRKQFEPGQIAWMHLKPKPDDRQETAASASLLIPSAPRD
jgi:sulfatase-like protein